MAAGNNEVYTTVRDNFAGPSSGYSVGENCVTIDKPVVVSMAD
jgi:hypothetical protein